MKINKKNISTAISALLLLNIIFISGCAYFNTFFNAKQAYKRGVRAVEADPQGNVSSNAITDFNLAIEKASKLLELHPGSKYVDDALLMIGRCYYFMGDFDKSKRSLEDLFNNLPNSKLIPEARTVYAQILLEEDRPGLVELEYRKIIENEHSSQIYKNEAYFGLANLLIFNEDYDGAIEQLMELVSEVEDEEFKSEIQLKIAQSYFEKGEYLSAAEEFVKINEFDPSIEVEFLGYIGRGNCLINLELYEEAVTLYREVLVKSEFWDNYVDIYIELARAREMSGREEAAIEILMESSYFDPLEGKLKLDSIRVEVPPDTSIKDSLGNRLYTESTIEIRPPAPVKLNAEPEFYIGEIYFKKKYNFEKAKEHYNRAKSAAPSPEILEEINYRVNIVDEINSLNQRIKQSPPRIPVLDDNPDELFFWRDSMQALPDTIFKTLAPLVSLRRDTVRLDTANMDSSIFRIDTVYIPRQDTVLKSVILDTNRVKQINELQSIGNEVLRRSDFDSTIEVSEYLITPNLSTYLNAYSNYPEGLFRHELSIVTSLYRLGEIFDIELNDPDSSYTRLDLILENFPDHDISPKVLFYKYDMALRYELGIHEEVRSELMNNFGNSVYAKFLKGDSTMLVPEEVVFNPFDIDSGAIRYKEAEKLLFEEKFEEALRQFRLISRYSDSPEWRAKSLFATAWIYEYKYGDNIKAIEFYENLKSEFGNTPYGRAATEKLLEVDKWRMMIETNKRIFQRQLSDIIQIKLDQAFSDTAGVITLDSLSLLAVTDSLEIIVSDSLIIFNRVANIVQKKILSSFVDSTGAVYLDSLSYDYVHDSLRIMITDSIAPFLLDSLSALRIVLDVSELVPDDSIKTLKPDSTIVTDTTAGLIPDTLTIELDSTGIIKKDTTNIALPDSIANPDSTKTIKPDSTKKQLKENNP